MKHTRLIICLVLLLALSSILVACGSGYRDDLSAATVMASVKAALPPADGYSVARDSFINESDWGADYLTLLDALADRQILLSERADSNIDEVGILLVGDGEDFAAIKKIVEDYVSAKQKKLKPLLESYNTNELPKLDQARITVCGRYILYTFLDADSTAKAHEAFKTALTA